MTEPSVLEELRRLAEHGAIEAFRQKASDLHASDLSDVLAGLDEEARINLVRALPPEMVSAALAEMEPDEHPEELLAALDPERAADIVEELEDDDAADLIGDLPPDKATSILASIDDRAEIERLLEYDEETAGGIMTAAVVTVRASATAAEAIDAIRMQSDEVEDLYQVYCTDGDGALVGVLPLQSLVRAPANAVVRQIMEPAPSVATPDMDQEEVARLMARYNVASVPVVDAGGRLLGRITFDDVIDVVEAEQTEDLLKFGGVPGDEQLGALWHQAVRSRLPWLFVNLLTASLSGGVVWLFRDVITGTWMLAALVPVVAGMGGNAGTQALAVTVRRVSLGLIPKGTARLVVAKELLVGFINGLTVGSVVGLVAWSVGGQWIFGVVVVLAMWGNLIVAGFAGSSIPLLLERVGLDPAVASSVFVTAFTDVCGYFLILSLASALILSP
jgi:magnesium transporter